MPDTSRPGGPRIRPELQAADELSPQQREDLAELVDAARQRRRREFDAALEEATRHLPRLVRGPARRILFGTS